MLRDHRVRIEELSARMDGGAELADLGREATDFLQWHRWCRSIKQGYLNCGWPGILAVFYFEIEPAWDGVDASLWVIVGDIPPAYLDLVNCPDAASALDEYLYAMQEWVDHVQAGKSVAELIPVYQRVSLERLKPSAEFAKMLQSRLEFIRTKIIPTL